MYGMIHKAARAFVLARSGAETWNDVLLTCQLNDEHFISGQHYGDDVTVGLLAEIAKATDMEVGDLLFDFGQYWIQFTGASSYSAVMDMAGDDLVTFLENLDAMHRSIKATMPEAVMPTFAVIRHSPEQIELLYRSERSGLEDFVRGLLSGLLERFSEHGDVTVGQRNGELIFSIARRQAA